MIVLDAFALLGLYALYRSWKYKRPSLPLPPGPKGLPLVGNLFDMPKAFEWRTFHKWAKELETDIIYLNIAGQSVVIIDSASAAVELLERRSSLYSGRPRLPMINELMGWDFDFGFMDYGDTWRRHRRLMHNAFHPAASKQFLPHLSKATLAFLNNMLDKPESLVENIRSMAGQTILSIAYGIEMQKNNDPYIADAHRAIKPVSLAAVPGAFLVDTFPALKYVPDWAPGAGFKAKARMWRSYARQMIERPFEAAKNMMAEGTCPRCFVSICLDMKEDSSLIYDEDVVQSVAGTMYTAGADTTVAVLTACILGLLSRPDVVKKAQDDLDKVVKLGHLPDFEDEPSLPFITAIAKETMRWRVTLPTAVPHLLHADDEYKGYRIPAGSIIIPNTWAMLNDEGIYPDPLTFRPERFMENNYLRQDVRDPGHATWGFGRRICPGRFIAFPAVWIAIASLIYAFNIEKKVDETGNVIQPNHEDTVGLVNMPKPYAYRITPRSLAIEKLIRESKILYL
ncbi:cytochrome P450 [Crepidotus variabilis]|uniref:Cytochrome P450 n=1 Tax=Crepidotus variabilis TaxID=179855 RepID=A0A9P6EIZ0_9AGAR|nr:cytochrome P450 [Crepidotus variabilis]